MFRYLITIKPLGMMYGSSGGFLSAENLVGSSRAKFPPEAAALSGLILSANKVKYENVSEAEQKQKNDDLTENLCVAGPFWAKCDDPSYFYLPMPWTKIISDEGFNEWILQNDRWKLKDETEGKKDLQPDYPWLCVGGWNQPADLIQENEWAAKTPWKFTPVLHPSMKDDERHVRDKDGLFLEYAVQVPDDICLVYLSTKSIENGWYRFGGENHVVEVECIDLSEYDFLLDLFQQKIDKYFALITPGVWGSNRYSYRYPQHPDFPKPAAMLTDKPVPYRYRAGKQLGRGRYAVLPGSVYVLNESLGKSWWDWSEDWFPKEGFHLKKVGCGLCLPLEIESEL